MQAGLAVHAKAYPPCVQCNGALFIVFDVFFRVFIACHKIKNTKKNQT